MDSLGNKIGIVGCGAVGKSIITFLRKKYPDIKLSIIDQRSLNTEELKFLTLNNVAHIDYEYHNAFITLQDHIFISPGIDRAPFQHAQHKWIEEVDLFFELCTKPVIAITGSAGKTSTLLLLEHILKKQKLNAIACGNVGYPLLSALLEQENVDYFIAELSSFQLEFTTQCTPDYALITNLSDNHLDRHITLENYKNAKAQIFKNQKNSQYACLPFELFQEFALVIEHQKIVLFSSTDNNYNITQQLSDITCLANWNSVCTLLELIEKLPTIEQLEDYCADFTLEHRVEYVCTYQNMIFYNDSKATLPLSTQNAISYFKTQPIIIMVGGFSKGVNRKSFIQSLPENVIHIECFGLEALELASYCDLFGRSYTVHTTIKEAFDHTLTVTQESVIILFSPAGATHTHEFANYKERGNYFKLLAHSLQQNNYLYQEKVSSSKK